MENKNELSAKLLDDYSISAMKLQTMQTPSHKHRTPHKFFELKKSDESYLTKQDEGLVINECATNVLRITLATENYKSFTCKTCTDKPNYICEWCYLNCHRHDKGKLTSGVMTSIKFRRCSCANADHKIEENKTDMDSMKTNIKNNFSSENICTLNDFFFQLESEFYFFKTNYNDYSVDDNLCIYCLNFCMYKKYPDFKDSLNELTYSVSKTQFNSENLPNCKCKNIKCHMNPPEIYNTKCLKEMINIENKYDTFFNSIHFCTAFVQSKYFENIEQPILEFHNKIKRIQDFTKLQSKPLTLPYLESITVIESLGKYIRKTNEYVNLGRFQQSLDDLYNFDFLKLLFNIPPAKNCSLLKVKLSCAYLYRINVLEAKPLFLAIREYGSRENFSPLHALALKQNSFSLTKNIGDSSTVFEIIYFVTIMLKQAQEYNGKHDEENLYFEFIAETLKWVNYIISFKFDEEYYIFDIIQNLGDLINMVKEKKKYEHILRRELEKVTLSLIYFKNEYVLIDYLNKICSQNSQNSENKNIDRNEIDRRSFVFEKNRKSEYGYLSQFDIIKSFFSSDQTKVEGLSFKFSSPSLNMYIHLALFSNRDYFSESLKAILESNSNCINENFQNKIIIDTDEGFESNGNEILGEFYFEKFKNNAIKLSDLRHSYFHNQLSTNVFLNTAKLELENLYTDIQTVLELELHNEKIKTEQNLSNDEIIIKNHKQIYICKIGYINLLLNYINTLTGDYIFSNFHNESSGVFRQIIEIFKLLTKNNAFNSCLFFNDIMPRIIFKKKELYNISLNFYYDLLIILKTENYKLGWSYISYICSFLQEEISVNKNENHLKIFFKFLNYYIDNLNSNLYEFASSIISNNLNSMIQSDYFYENLQNYHILKNFADKLIIREIIKLLGKISNYYFYFIIGGKSNMIENIGKVIEKYDNLDLEEFNIFSKFIFRCNCESPFTININYDKNMFEDILTRIDANLIGRTNNKDQSEVDEKGQQEEFDENIMGLKNVKFLLKKFKSIFLNFKNRGLFNEYGIYEIIDFYFKYFIEICVSPCIFSIYKIKYFTEQQNSDLRYLIYNIVITFLQILNFFCEEMTKVLSENSNHISEKIKELINNKLNINNFESANLIQEFITIGNSAKADIEKINSPKFNQLSYYHVVKIFSTHISLFKDVEKIRNCDIGQFVMNKEVLLIKFQEDSFRQALQNIYLDYSNSKNDFSKSAVAELYNSEYIYCYKSDRQFLSNTIKKNIAVEFLTHYRKTDSLSCIYGNDYDSCIFPRDNAIYIEILLKLFKLSPDFFQQVIMDNPVMQEKIFLMLGHQVTYLYQNVVVEYMSLNKKENLYAYENLINLIEFGRLLAENHNQMFQTFLINFRHYEKETKFSITFFQMILKITMFIIKLIKHNKKKMKFTKVLKNDSGVSYIYFNNLITYLHNFLIEIVQGTLGSNFNIISEDPVFITYVKLTRDLLNKQGLDQYTFYLGKSFSFLNAYTEDINNKSKQPVEYFKADKCYEVFLNCFKLLFYIGHEYNSDNGKRPLKSIDSSYDVYTFDVSLKDEDSKLKNFTVKEGDHKIVNDLFISGYLNENNPYYVLAFQIFYMFKLVEINPNLCKDGLFGNILKNMSSTFDIDNKTPLNDALVKETSSFFNEMIKSVEIIATRKNEISESDLFRYYKYFDDNSYMKKIYKKAKKEILKSTANDQLLKILFINKPNLRFLTHKDTHDFLEIAIKKEHSYRKYLMLEHVEERLIPIIEVRKKLSMDKSNLINYIYNIDYTSHVKISVLISLIINILLVFSMKYDNIDSPSLSPYEINYSCVRTYITYLNICHLVYLGLIICSFTTVKIYEEINLDIFGNNLYIFLGSIRSIVNHEAVSLVWNFICGCLANISIPFSFFYALQLFSMMSIFPIMKAAISSIFLRYGQFFSTALLLIIICIFYGSICIFFLNSGMIDGGSGKSTCETFWQCVLHIFNGGIRSGSLGFPVKASTANGYWQEFVVDWTFYLMVILILLNFVNGIIVDTFNELYEANLVKIDTLKDTCFICDQKRSKYEVVGIDFEKHKYNHHSLLNYFYYIIKIKSEDKHDLNALDSMVLESIVARRTDFIPVKKSWDMLHLADEEEEGENKKNKNNNSKDSLEKPEESDSEDITDSDESEESHDSQEDDEETESEDESSSIQKKQKNFYENDEEKKIINEEKHITKEAIEEIATNLLEENQVVQENEKKAENKVQEKYNKNKKDEDEMDELGEDDDDEDDDEDGEEDEDEDDDEEEDDEEEDDEDEEEEVKIKKKGKSKKK